MQLLFIAALALLSIPLFIHKLGAVNYGLFSLLSLILTLPFFAGLGLNTSLVKFIARQGRSAESKFDILAVATIQLATLLVFIALLFTFKDFFLHDILGVPDELLSTPRTITENTAADIQIPETGSPVPRDITSNTAAEIFTPAGETPAHAPVHLFTCLLFTSLFLTGMQLTRSILMGLQLAWVTNLLQMVYNLLFYGSMIVLLLLDYGLDAIGYGILAAAFIGLMASLLVTRTIWKKTNPGTSGPVDERTSGQVNKWTSGQVFETQNAKPETRNAKRETRNRFVASLRKQLSSGLQIFSAELVAYFTEPVSRILIAHFIGIRETGYFDIAIRIKAQLQGIVTRLFDPFLPWIAAIGDRDRIDHILRDVEQKYLLLSLPLAVMLPFVMKPVLDIWLGTGNNHMLTVASMAITITFLCTMAVLSVYYYLLSHDLTKKAILLNLATVIANAAIFLLLYQSLGFYAAVIALCASAFVNLVMSLWIQRGQFRDQRVSRLAFSVSCFKNWSTGPPVHWSAGPLVRQSAGPLVRLSTGSRLVLTVLILFAANVLLYLTLSNPWALTGMVFSVTVILAIVLYKYLQLITSGDIETYFGTRNRVGAALAGFFDHRETGGRVDQRTGGPVD